MTLTTRAKIIAINIIWAMSRIMCLFPIDANKIFFMSYNGKQYSDSPKYISDYYLKKNQKNRMKTRPKDF